MPKVLVVDTESTSPHLEIGMEIAISRAEDGWETLYSYIGGVLADSSLGLRSGARYRRGNFWPVKSLGKILRIRRFLVLMNRYGRKRSLKLTAVEARSSRLNAGYPQLDAPDTLEELKRVHMQGFPIGQYLVSSMVSESRNSLVSPSREKSLFLKTQKRFWEAFFQTRDLLENFPADEIVLYNGRFAESGGILMAAQQRSVRTFFHERGGADVVSYFLHDWRPQQMAHLGALARKMWADLSESERSAQTLILSGKIEDARSGGGFGGKKFDHSAEVFFEADHNQSVVVFTSSEDEFEALDETAADSLFVDQYDAVRAIDQVCAEAGLSLVVRVHPHLREKSVSERFRWDEGLKKDLQKGLVIPSISNVNSYELVDRAGLIIVWYSTIGLEAVYSGKPVIALADTPYTFAGADVISKPAAITAELLKQSMKRVPERNSVFPYLYFFSSHGTPFRFVDPQKNVFLGRRTPKTWSWESSFRKYLRELLKKHTKFGVK